MRVWPKNRYVPGDYKRECDVCGFDFLRSELMKRWDGAIVCKYDWEEKDPQLTKRVHKEGPFKRD